jgi:hypothetical protein
MAMGQGVRHRMRQAEAPIPASLCVCIAAPTSPGSPEGGWSGCSILVLQTGITSFRGRSTFSGNAGNQESAGVAKPTFLGTLETTRSASNSDLLFGK